MILTELLAKDEAPLDRQAAPPRAMAFHAE
jgi:hypothetical protein